MGSEPYPDSVGGGRTWKESVLMRLCRAREDKTETHGPFSDREFDISSGLVAVAVAENAKRLTCENYKTPVLAGVP